MTQPLVSNKRRYFRQPVSLPLKFQPSQAKEIGRSNSCDISEGGLCLLSSKFLAKGVALQLTLPVDGEVFRLEGKVAYSNHVSHFNSYRTGVEFSGSTAQFRSKFAKQTDKIKLYQAQLSEKYDREVGDEEAARKWVECFAKHFSEIF